MSNANSNSRLVYWILGALLSVLLLLTSIFTNETQRRVSLAEEKLRADSERITLLEAHYQTILERQKSIEMKLDRIINDLSSSRQR